MSRRCVTTGRPLQFYRPTRSQAPKYARIPELAAHFECSICRGLFFADTPAERQAHAHAHATPLPQVPTRCGHPTCGEFTTACRVCGEDICADFRCQHHHRTTQCAEFARAWALIDAGQEAEGEALLDRLIVADR